MMAAVLVLVTEIQALYLMTADLVQTGQVVTVASQVAAAAAVVEVPLVESLAEQDGVETKK